MPETAAVTARRRGFKWEAAGLPVDFPWPMVDAAVTGAQLLHHLAAGAEDDVALLIRRGHPWNPDPAHGQEGAPWMR